MLNKTKDIFYNYKYLLNSKFHLSKKHLLLLFLISSISLIFSFVVIFSSIPFLDLMLGNNPSEYQIPTKYLINILDKLNLEGTFFIFGSLFILSIILKSVCDVLYGYYAISLQFEFMGQETLNLNKIIFGMSQRFYIKHSTSKIFNLYTRELERAAEVISSLMLAVNAFLQIIIFIVIPIYLNTKFTIIFLVLIIILLSPLLIVNYLSIKQGFIATIVSDNLFKSLNNNFLYSKFISIHGLIIKANSLFLESYNKYVKNKKKLTLLSGISGNFIQPIGIFTIVITVFFVIGKVDNLPIIGGILWSLTRTLNPINIILQALNTISSQIGAFKNIYETKNNFKSFKIQNGNFLIDKFQKLSFNNIVFKYDDKLVLDNLSLEIKNGEKIAILGETGSGKSTLLDIITNVTNLTHGNRKINDVNYEEIDFQEFRKKISYVPQSLTLLDANIREYFEFYNYNIDDKKINDLLDFFNCTEFLGNSPTRVDYYLGDKGIKLSGGQKQKIILAAALSRNPELLLLDETTNAIDHYEEQKILTKILNQNITLVFISHKLQNKELFDKIIKIENKKLIKLK